MTGKHESRDANSRGLRRKSDGSSNRTSSTRNQKSWQKRSGGYKIKHGKNADEQAKGESIETKHKTPSLKGSPY